MSKTKDIVTKDIDVKGLGVGFYFGSKNYDKISIALGDLSRNSAFFRTEVKLQLGRRGVNGEVK